MSDRPGIRVEAVRAIGAKTATATRVDPDAPFRILVLADLGGRASRGLARADALAATPRAIDRDDLEPVLAALQPVLRLPLGADGRTEEVVFRELDDFHPDALFARVPVFAALRRLRARLADPATAAAALAEMKRGTAPADPAGAPAADGGGALGFDALESALRAAEAAPRPADDLVARLVREFVAPHAVQRPDPRVADCIADVDRALEAQMRAVLTAKACRGLEGTWRALDLLVRRVETDGRLTIRVLDASLDDLRAALAPGADPRQSALAKLFAAQAPAVVVGDYEFAAGIADVALLGAIAEAAAHTGTVFVAAAAAGLVGAPDLAAAPDPDDWTSPPSADVAAAWQQLRASPAAAHVGLVMPRFLLRLPYGRRTSPITAFPFEEEGEAPTSADLLWGNGAFLVAMLLAATFRRDGHAATRLADDRIDDLPGHVRLRDGEAEAMPVTGCALTTRGGQRIAAAGCMPLYGERGTTAVVLGALRSIAAGDAALGRFGRS